MHEPTLRYKCCVIFSAFLSAVLFVLRALCGDFAAVGLGFLSAPDCQNIYNKLDDKTTHSHSSNPSLPFLPTPTHPHASMRPPAAASSTRVRITAASMLTDAFNLRSSAVICGSFFSETMAAWVFYRRAEIVENTLIRVRISSY